MKIEIGQKYQHYKTRDMFLEKINLSESDESIYRFVRV